LRDLRYGSNDYFFAYDRTGVSHVAPDPKTEGQTRWDLKDFDGVPFVRELIEGAARGGAFVAYRYPRAGGTEPTSKLAYSMTFKPNGWMIGSGVYIDDIDAIFRTQVWYIGSFAAVILLLVNGAGFLLGRSITRPVNTLTGVMRDLAGGNPDVAIRYTNQRDELGEMARAVVVFKDNALAVRRLRAEQDEEHQRAETEKRTALTNMANTIETETGTALEHIRQRTTAMTVTADAMSASAGRTGAAADTAANAAGQALANAQSVAGAAEQLSASIREISSQMSQSSAVVGRAVIAGRETRATMEALNQEVEQIGAVADMIGAIAAKTNLLALNATIEAARAGDAGKGFAVVASEVKALAAQTARSTKEITRHIDQVRAATEASVAAVGRIEATITEVNAIAGSIAAAVEQQGAATSEIARNVTETATAANEMTTRTHEVSAEASETGRQAADVRANAIGLSNAMEELRHSVIRVLRTSTTEVDRRADRRRPCLIEATIAYGGQSETVSIHDISESGCFIAAKPRGQVSRLDIALAGSGRRLQGNVTQQSDDGLHVAFTGQKLATADVDRISLETTAQLVKVATSDHVAFVKRVADAVSNRGALAPDSLATHHSCRFGRWHDHISDPATLALPSFRAMDEPHRRVHRGGSSRPLGVGRGRYRGRATSGGGDAAAFGARAGLPRRVRPRLSRHRWRSSTDGRLITAYRTGRLPSTPAIVPDGGVRELFLVDERVLRPAQLQADRRARQLERVAQAVHQIAGVVLRRLFRARSEHHEGRRPGLGLGHIAQLQPAAADQRRLVGLQRMLEPAVQFSGGNALVPYLMRLTNGGQQPVHPGAGQRGQRHYGDALHLRQAVLQPLHDRLAGRVAIGHGVPFVQGDDAGPALALDQAGDLQILVVDALSRVQGQHHDLGHF
jgi:methyl-accepting chemotaxis protein